MIARTKIEGGKGYLLVLFEGQVERDAAEQGTPHMQVALQVMMMPQPGARQT